VRVAFLGLGRMGAPMAARLSDFDLTVWNRTPRPERVPAGATIADTPSAAVADADVVVTMVADGGALIALIEGPDGVLSGDLAAGAVLVDMSTIGPSAAHDVASRAARAGIAFLDAPVSGSTPAAQSGQLVAMVGGPARALERVRPVLAAMTREQLHLGETGTGAAMKLALNLALAVTNQTIAETLLLAERAGIARAAAYDVLEAGALASPYVGYKRAAFEDPEGSPVAFSIELMRKDVRLALELARRAGLDLPAGQSAAAGLDRALDGGLGDADLVSVLRALDAA
jgi:3-hydroxyisobutyrate dehydrogenase-like beta-hydroxyacid dehydrogenase